MMELLVDYGFAPSIGTGIDPDSGPGVCVVEGDLTGGFVSRDLGLGLVTEEEIFGRVAGSSGGSAAGNGERPGTVASTETNATTRPIEIRRGRFTRRIISIHPPW